MQTRLRSQHHLHWNGYFVYQSFSLIYKVLLSIIVHSSKRNFEFYSELQKSTPTNCVNNTGSTGSNPGPTTPDVAHGQDSLMMMQESPAVNQLMTYAATHPNDTEAYAETVAGIVYPTLTASLKVGRRGPVLLQDSFLIEKLQLFNRERIPERVVHAKGAGK